MMDINKILGKKKGKNPFDTTLSKTIGKNPVSSMLKDNFKFKKFGGKNDWDGDGVPNKRDCQPRNPMRQDEVSYRKALAILKERGESPEYYDKIAPGRMSLKFPNYGIGRPSLKPDTKKLIDPLVDEITPEGRYIFNVDVQPGEKEKYRQSLDNKNIVRRRERLKAKLRLEINQVVPDGRIGKLFNDEITIVYEKIPYTTTGANALNQRKNAVENYLKQTYGVIVKGKITTMDPNIGHSNEGTEIEYWIEFNLKPLFNKVIGE